MANYKPSEVLCSKRRMCLELGDPSLLSPDCCSLQAERNDVTSCEIGLGQLHGSQSACLLTVVQLEIEYYIDLGILVLFVQL